MLLQVLLNQREALHARIVHLEKFRSGSVISAHTAIEGSGDAGIAANSSRPGGSTLAQSVVKPHALTGGQQVGAGEIGAVSALSSAAGVLFGGSSQLAAVSKPQFGISSVGGKGSIPAPKSLQDPGNTPSKFPLVVFRMVSSVRCCPGPP